MDSRFEHPAKPIIEQKMLTDWTGPLSIAEWVTVGEWWAKTLLLIGHPNSRYESSRLDRALVHFPPPLPDYTWLVDGSPPPSHLSLFVFRADVSLRSTKYRLAIPELVTGPAGEMDACHVLALAMPGLSVALVSHPGIIIDHPLVSRGEAWELLRGSPPNGDFATLPQHSYQVLQMPRRGSVSRGHIVDTGAASTLTTLLEAPTETPSVGRPSSNRLARWCRRQTD